MNTLIYIPASIAIIFDILLISYIIIKKLNKSIYLVGLVASFISLNAIELIGYSGLSTSLLLFKLYYVFSIISLILTISLAQIITEKKYIIFNMTNFIGFALIVLLLSGDLIILDYKPLRHSYIHIPGKYYIIFEIFAVVYLISCLVLIFFNIYSGKIMKPVRSRSSIILISLLPAVLISLATIYLRALGFGANLTIYFPITTFIFSLGCFYSQTENPYDWSLFFPFSPSRREANSLTFLMRTKINCSNFYKSAELIEKNILFNKIKDTNGEISITDLAKTFNVSIGKIDYRLKKYDLKKHLK